MPLSAQAVIEHDLPTVALPIVALPCASRPTRQPRTVVPVIVTSPVGSHLDPDHTRAVLDDAVPEHGGAWRSMAEHGGAWRSMAEHGGAWRSMAEHGGAWGRVRVGNLVSADSRQPQRPASDIEHEEVLELISTRMLEPLRPVGYAEDANGVRSPSRTCREIGPS